MCTPALWLQLQTRLELELARRVLLVPFGGSDGFEDLERSFGNFPCLLVSYRPLGFIVSRLGLGFEICASRDCQDRPVGVSDCEFKSQPLRVSSSASRRAHSPQHF